MPKIEEIEAGVVSVDWMRHLWPVVRQGIQYRLTPVDPEEAVKEGSSFVCDVWSEDKLASIRLMLNEPDITGAVVIGKLEFYKPMYVLYGTNGDRQWYRTDWR